jgi:hypothetical protein
MTWYGAHNRVICEAGRLFRDEAGYSLQKRFEVAKALEVCVDVNPAVMQKNFIAQHIRLPGPRGGSPKGFCIDQAIDMGVGPGMQGPAGMVT